jgi:hypothetical protein
VVPKADYRWLKLNGNQENGDDEYKTYTFNELIKDIREVGLRFFFKLGGT